MRLQARNQLLSAAQIVQRVMNTEVLGGSELLTEDKEVLKSILKINRVLKQTQTFLDINYAVVGINGKVIFPREASLEPDAISNHIMPALKKKIAISSQKEKRIIYFNADNSKYVSLLQNINTEENKRLGTLVLYSDLNNSRRIMINVNLMLLSIMFFTGLAALYVSSRVSKKISKPISELSDYAKKIGERQYKVEALSYEEDEIGDLAKTMEAMADKLNTYDSTMKTFLQNSSHELRTPLMSIQGYAEGIKHGVVEDKEGAVEIIIEESKRLTNIVEDLLYLSKLDARQEDMNLDTLQAEEFLRDCMERVNGIALQKEIKLSLLTIEDLIVFKADEEKLSRAVINVLGNCLRYAKKEIKVYLSREASKVIITIEDDGPGFEPQELPNIFDRFFKGSGGKYGLGLAITKSIIEKHKGSIAAINNSEGGALFRISIPQ
jgi:signal transduction histidine kinase